MELTSRSTTSTMRAASRLVIGDTLRRQGNDHLVDPPSYSGSLADSYEDFKSLISRFKDAYAPPYEQTREVSTSSTTAAFKRKPSRSLSAQVNPLISRWPGASGAY
jgi:hypothetical protein